MPHVHFIHGLDNKPPADYLHQAWNRKLAHDDGLALADHGVATGMVYWADVLYPTPDTDLAKYESNAGDLQLPAAQTPLSTEEAARVAALAARFGVDPTAPDVAPPAADLAGVMQERLPVPDWLRERIMKQFVRDAHHYFFNVEVSPRPGQRYRVRDELRARFIAALRAGAAGGGPQVVLSHSMGTIIAYDCLMNVPDCPAIEGLVTVGSPLGLSEVQAFFPGFDAGNAFPSARLRGRWVNVYDPLDVVAALDPCFADDYQRAGHEVVEDLREDNWGTWRHSIAKYLQGPKLRARLAQILALDWP